MFNTIRIIKVPDGPAPEWVRKEWVGLKLRRAFNLPEDAVEYDHKNYKIIGNRGGFVVNAVEAITTLSDKSREAAEWFENNLPKNLAWLSFGPDEVKVLD